MSTCGCGNPRCWGRCPYVEIGLRDVATNIDCISIEIESLGSLGRYLKKARQMAGLSAQTLAEKLGYDPDVLESKEDAGYPDLTILEAEQVLRACGLSVRVMVGKNV